MTFTTVRVSEVAEAIEAQLDEAFGTQSNPGKLRGITPTCPAERPMHVDGVYTRGELVEFMDWLAAGAPILKDKAKYMHMRRLQFARTIDLGAVTGELHGGILDLRHNPMYDSDGVVVKCDCGLYVGGTIDESLFEVPRSSNRYPAEHGHICAGAERSGAVVDRQFLDSGRRPDLVFDGALVANVNLASMTSPTYYDQTQDILEAAGRARREVLMTNVYGDPLLSGKVPLSVDALEYRDTFAPVTEEAVERFRSNPTAWRQDAVESLTDERPMRGVGLPFSGLHKGRLVSLALRPTSAPMLAITSLGIVATIHRNARTRRFEIDFSRARAGHEGIFRSVRLAAQEAMLHGFGV
jgi:hypothetical protein